MRAAETKTLNLRSGEQCERRAALQPAFSPAREGGVRSFYIFLQVDQARWWHRLQPVKARPLKAGSSVRTDHGLDRVSLPMVIPRGYNRLNANAWNPTPLSGVSLVLR